MRCCVDSPKNYAAYAINYTGLRIAVCSGHQYDQNVFGLVLFNHSLFVAVAAAMRCPASKQIPPGFLFRLRLFSQALENV